MYLLCFYQRLGSVPISVYHPLLEADFKSGATADGNGSTATAPKLPVVIRERDVEYQLERIVVFHRLLLGFPYTKPRLIQEAKIDIPPLYRGKVWAAILDVRVSSVGSHGIIGLNWNKIQVLWLG